jgi:hypothetical protein
MKDNGVQRCCNGTDQATCKRYASRLLVGVSERTQNFAGDLVSQDVREAPVTLPMPQLETTPEEGVTLKLPQTEKERA